MRRIIELMGIVDFSENLNKKMKNYIFKISQNKNSQILSAKF